MALFLPLLKYSGVAHFIAGSGQNTVSVRTSVGQSGFKHLCQRH